jgi:hypothetical protein
MKKLIIIVLCLILCAFSVFGQDAKVNADPKKAKFVTSDVDNFWRAFDLAGKETDEARKIAIYQAEYLDKGSVGLQDFLRLRIKSAKDLVGTVEKLRGFYGSVRASTLRVKELEKKMRKAFAKFKKIYADAVFPDVYFVIGITNTGGTASKNGLLIGTELYGLTANTQRDEFLPLFRARVAKEESDEKVRALTERLLNIMLKPVERLPAIVAHESCHFNQKYASLDTLLAKAVQEGACDFIAERAAGETINPQQKIYGDRNEAALWKEFETQMAGKDYSNWMYNGFSAVERPPDLGYYVGYKISLAYYKQARDKKQAIKDILETKDFPALYEKSGYRKKFETTK